MSSPRTTRPPKQSVRSSLRKPPPIQTTLSSPLTQTQGFLRLQSPHLFVRQRSKPSKRHTHAPSIRSPLSTIMSANNSPNDIYPVSPANPPLDDVPSDSESSQYSDPNNFNKCRYLSNDLLRHVIVLLKWRDDGNEVQAKMLTIICQRLAERRFAIPACVVSFLNDICNPPQPDTNPSQPDIGSSKAGPSSFQPGTSNNASFSQPSACVAKDPRSSVTDTPFLRY
ncbi:hypothetical protein HGRIS_001608 [Hohenbuehelia grisea]|uniref:Uncharacterized protein n=1 Tax=Hohenbuehelia grisea TaxID=104357 RepID=A0ABR3JJN4_9AGAR